MAVSSENEKLYQLMNAAPAAQQSPEAAQAAAQLAAAEQAAQNANYSSTADARLDRAIGEYLTKSGFNYDIGSDNNYKEFAREYSQNALRGRNSAQEGANQLAGGWAPSYADAVTSAVQGDISANAANYATAFRALGRQEAAARAAQAGQSAQILQGLADAEYAKRRDAQGDRMNFLNYLADRYGTERQADVQRQGFAGDVYRSQLSNAMENAAQARNIDNAQYRLNTQSAESAAKLAADQRAFEQKMAYTAAEDAYKDRLAAAKAAKTAAKAAATAAKEQAKANAARDKNIYMAQRIISGAKKATENDLYELDLNRNGTVDNDDLRMLRDGTTAENLESTKTAVMQTSGAARDLITTIREMRREKKYQNTSIQEIAKKVVEKSDLSDDEAAFVYNYFGL